MTSEPMTAAGRALLNYDLFDPDDRTFVPTADAERFVRDIEAEARAAAERDVAELRQRVETEWYNGNVNLGARERILDNPAAAEPCPGCGTLDGQHAVSCHGVDESEPPAARLAELLASRVEEAQRTVREEWPEWLRRNRDAVHVPIKPAEPRWPSGPDFVFERLENLEAVRMSIRECEGHHVQQVCYSTYHDALTQVCFTERRVRANVDVAALQEKRDPGE